MKSFVCNSLAHDSQEAVMCNRTISFKQGIKVPKYGTRLSSEQILMPLAGWRYYSRNVLCHLPWNQEQGLHG